MLDVAIINYGMGNLFSVFCACKSIGLNAQITDDEEVIRNSKILILPGVGAFGAAMEIIKKKNIDKAIYEHIGKDKKIIGICLGMQLLFERSYEFTLNKGLGILKGDVKMFSINESNLLNVGWNKIIKKKKNTLLDLNSKKDKFYFIHSLFAEPKDTSIISAISEFNKQTFCCGIKYKNIEAFQFHPEKSADFGLKIFQSLKNEIKKNF